MKPINKTCCKNCTKPSLLNSGISYHNLECPCHAEPENPTECEHENTTESCRDCGKHLGDWGDMPECKHENGSHWNQNEESACNDCGELVFIEPDKIKDWATEFDKLMNNEDDVKVADVIYMDVDKVKSFIRDLLIDRDREWFELNKEKLAQAVEAERGRIEKALHKVAMYHLSTAFSHLLPCYSCSDVLDILKPKLTKTNP